MICEVVQKGAEILRTQCHAVTDLSAAQVVIDDLLDTINHLKTNDDFKRGIGLAASQIGVPIRVAVAEFDGTQYVLVNPEITATSVAKKRIREGCLSFFAYRAFVPRYESVTVKAYDRGGNTYMVKGHGDSAMLLQHEIDHLDGILCSDHLPNGDRDLIEWQEV